MSNKFSGIIGFVDTVETDPINHPGVFEEIETRRKYRGDILQDSRRRENSVYMTTNTDINVTNRFSIIADAYAEFNFYAIRYIEWKGKKWLVNNVEVNRPRLTLYVGGLYNG